MLEASRDELRVLAEEQAALRRVATLVARETAPDAVFAAVAREVGEVLGVDATHLGRFDAGRHGRQRRAVGPLRGRADRGALSAGGRQRVGAGAADRAAGADGRLRRTPRAPSRRRCGGSASASPSASRSPSTGGPWGVMIATSKPAEPFPVETESRLQDFTELVATADLQRQRPRPGARPGATSRRRCAGSPPSSRARRRRPRSSRRSPRRSGGCSVSTRSRWSATRTTGSRPSWPVGARSLRRSRSGRACRSEAGTSPRSSSRPGAPHASTTTRTPSGRSRSGLTAAGVRSAVATPIVVEGAAVGRDDRGRARATPSCPRTPSRGSASSPS